MGSLTSVSRCWRPISPGWSAESVHASAVLACVAGGVYLRQYFSGAVAPATRIQARAVWELLIFILNGVIFILIGLQLGALRDAAPAGQFGQFCWPERGSA